MLKRKALDWLSTKALPLWLERGIDWSGGGFFENLSPEGEALIGPKRSMVQARQIYSFRTAIALGVCGTGPAANAIEHGATFLRGPCSLASGAFAHSVSPEGTVHDANPDLYAQAFALFGLAQLHALSPRAPLRARAFALLQYLERERKLPEGGYSELSQGHAVYVSNPHMHLLEAALAWMEVDGDPRWRALARSLLDLCLDRFIDAGTGMLAEQFTERWKPILWEGKFYFEPGHHYEWCWLMGRYEALTGEDLSTARLGLFDRAESYGVRSERGAVVDEVWSDGTVKTASSRFWSQCERVKAAAQLARTRKDERFRAAAEQALATLLRYFETPLPGLWFDTWSHEGIFVPQPAKASSLYHIIGAIQEYSAHPERTGE